MSGARKRIMTDFSAAAAHYDGQAALQREETRRVWAAAKAELPENARVVDLGCGTGYFAELAQTERSGWQIIGIDLAFGMCQAAARRSAVIQADALLLPLADRSCDAIVSSLCLQWVENLPAVFREMRRVLRPGGLIIFASLGAESLYELRKVRTVTELPIRLLPMRDAAAYQAASGELGLDMLHFGQDMTIRYYPDLVSLLDSMRRIGAGNNFTAPLRGMLGAQRWKRMLREYETLRGAKGLPATWERLLMILRKPV